ncbi:hypothetical protein DM02DRAFT_627867 [Periconia macrospinosa]|uniref:Uncharacterized protein n=1 Tax=Periconia macrospinosa TaxID=97972 RepID=A0A2V1DST8_9PLEO|nr:hypothetical protein DM02DRAFT_627867 [Periconia macrospinosa]
MTSHNQGYWCVWIQTPQTAILTKSKQGSEAQEGAKTLNLQGQTAHMGYEKQGLFFILAPRKVCLGKAQRSYPSCSLRSDAETTGSQVVATKNQDGYKMLRNHALQDSGTTTTGQGSLMLGLVLDHGRPAYMMDPEMIGEGAGSLLLLGKGDGDRTWLAVASLQLSIELNGTTVPLAAN